MESLITVLTYSATDAYHEFYTTGEFDLFQRIKEANIKLDTVFDVGCNHGYWSEMPPCEHIHCFDPIVETQNKFMELESKRNRPNKVYFNRYGLSDETKFETFKYDFSNDRLTSSLLDMARDNEKITTGLVVRGDEYCKMHEITYIDYLKIDTEGSEMKVLEGFGDMLQQSKIKMIQFEHGYANVLNKTLVLDYYNLLEPLGYTIGRLYSNGVAYKPYNLMDDDFRGPYFIAVHNSEPDLIFCTQIKNPI